MLFSHFLINFALRITKIASKKMSNVEHNHHHHHHHHASRGALMHIVSAVVLYILLKVVSGPIEELSFGYNLRLLLYIGLYLFVGYDVLWNAVKGILHGEWFDENFLMTVATLGVFALALYTGTDDYNEAITVMLFFKIGEYFQGYAAQKSVEKARVQNLSMNDEKSSSVAFITRFAKVYTPIVCIAAIALAIVVPVCSSIFGTDPDWQTWIYRALTFLVISCPCALVISIPMTFFAAIIGASKKEIYISDGCCLETLHKGTFPEGEIVLAVDNEENLNLARKIADKCMGIVWQNIIFAIGVKIVVLILSAFGITNMWLAVFADTGIMILAVLNALRAMKV